MIEEILPLIYRIEIPLPRNPLKTLNSYYIQGTDRSLLVDTGFNQPECRAAMDEGLSELGVSMDTTDILITHVHGDHSGLVHYLATPETRVFCDKYTALAFGDDPDKQWDYLLDMTRESGLIEVAITDHPGYKYRSAPVNNIRIVKDGDIITVGDFSLQCISTPGHAPDHICLYEANQKILFSGDHILGKITPNNTLWQKPWTATRDLLQEYLQSLDKIAELDIKLTLPAHRELITDCRGRIQELKKHHENRLQDVLNILNDQKMCGAQVARRMKWDIRNRDWDDFPIAQKMFATGEALSHLNHLVFKKLLVKELHDGLVYYSLASAE